MNDIIQLQLSEIIHDRPFSHPQENVADLQILQFMAKKLRTILTEAGDFSSQLDPIKLNIKDADGAHKIILVDWRYLMTNHDLTAVGFFGQARTDIDHTRIIKLEDTLIEQFGDYPGLLGYYNLHLPTGQWGNLVLCRDDAFKEHWRDNPTHQQAVEYTPSHYHSIRLHNGLIPGGMASQNGFKLVRTKYYDYREGKTWRAVREVR